MVFSMCIAMFFTIFFFKLRWTLLKNALTILSKLSTFINWNNVYNFNCRMSYLMLLHNAWRNFCMKTKLFFNEILHLKKNFYIVPFIEMNQTLRKPACILCFVAHKLIEYMYIFNHLQFQEMYHNWKSIFMRIYKIVSINILFYFHMISLINVRIVDC